MTDSVMEPQNNAGSRSDYKLHLHVEIEKNFPQTSDPFGIFKATAANDVLTLEVEFGGGCEEHDFAMYWNGEFQEEKPVSVDILVVHEANGDSCEAMNLQTLKVDISEIKEAFLQAYPDAAERVVTISFHGQNRQFGYRF